MLLLLDDKVLSSSKRDNGTGKIVGGVSGGGVGHNAQRSLPDEFGKAKRSLQFKVTAIGTLMTLIQTVIPRKIRIP